MERNQQEFQRYLEYQRTRRHDRVETLGGAATLLFLSTIDLGLIGASDPAAESFSAPKPEAAPAVEAAPLRTRRTQRLAAFAAENAELGYAQAA